MKTCFEESVFSGWSASLTPYHYPPSRTFAGESQRDSVHQPRVASPRATVGQATRESPTLKGLRHETHHREQKDATPWGLKIILRGAPRVGARRASPGLDDAISLGLIEATHQPVAK